MIISAARTKSSTQLRWWLSSSGPASLTRTGVPPVPGRSCQIRACNGYGTIRFLRLAGTELRKISQPGTLFDPLVHRKTPEKIPTLTGNLWIYLAVMGLFPTSRGSQDGD